MENVSKYIEYLKFISENSKNTNRKTIGLDIEEDLNEVKEEIIHKIEKEQIEEIEDVKEVNENDTCAEEIEEIEVKEVMVSSKSLYLSENTPYECDFEEGAKIIKAMVVLAKCKVIIPINFITKLKYPISAIKEIDKNVEMKKCNIFINKDTAILFVNLIINKNIEYYSKGNNIDVLRSNISNIPYSFQTKVKFNIMPNLKKNKKVRELEILDKNIKDKGNTIMGQNVRERNFNIGKYLNEKIVCRIREFEFMETDTIEGIQSRNYDIEERSVLSIGIELLQKQDITIK